MNIDFKKLEEFMAASEFIGKDNAKLLTVKFKNNEESMVSDARITEQMNSILKEMN